MDDRSRYLRVVALGPVSRRGTSLRFVRLCHFHTGHNFSQELIKRYPKGYGPVGVHPGKVVSVETCRDPFKALLDNFRESCVCGNLMNYVTVAQYSRFGKVGRSLGVSQTGTSAGDGPFEPPFCGGRNAFSLVTLCPSLSAISSS